MSRPAQPSVRTLRPRSGPAAACFVILFAVAGCDGAIDPAARLLPTAPSLATGTALPNNKLFSCTADVAARTVSCGGTSSGNPTTLADSSVVIGLQAKYVSLNVGSVTAAGGIFSVDLAVGNNFAQSLGTRDGVTADPRGIRLFVDPNVVTNGGSGKVTFTDPSTGAFLADGTGSFTATGQPFIRYTTLLPVGGKTAARALRFAVPAKVKRFTFLAGVNAGAPYPFGWINVRPDTATLAAGAKVTLASNVITLWGSRLNGTTVRYSSADTTVAKVATATGVVTAVGGGKAVITAHDGTRSGTATITVAGAPAPPPPPPPPPAPTLPPGSIVLTVNTAARHNISRFVYGMNLTNDYGGVYSGGSPWYGAQPPAEVTFDRFGGNRLTAYNWENNYSNAGNDYNYQNDNFLSQSTTPGEAVRSRVAAARGRGAGALVTVPMIGYVSADGAGPMDTRDATRTTRLATRFRQSLPSKGAPFTLNPSTTDAYVYQDEFVHWVNQTFPGAVTDPTRPIFFSLDNEPDIWHGTHKEIMSDSSDNANRPRLQSYTGFINTTIAYARAIKAVVPGATVFGPAVATYTGVATLGRWPSPDPVYGSQLFFDVYLDRLRQAEQTYGRRLVDVLDLHWYPAAGTPAGEISNDYATQDAAMTNARLQAPRSLWDPTYNENSWVNSVTGGPIALLPRLRAQIAARYPGTKIAITEYYYGRAGDISGGVTQADVLGIFGREGVFAATLWPQAGVWATPYNGSGAKAYAYAFGAFRMFLNFDGKGGRFGDTGVSATTSDPVTSSIYASLTPGGQVVLVLINKATTSRTTGLTVAHGSALRTAQVYTLTGSSPAPVRQADVAVGAGNTLVYTMPAMSVTTLLLVP